MSFQAVVMGCLGGAKETNLSGYLLAPIDQPGWIALDAGSLLAGIERAFEKKSLDPNDFSSETLLPQAQMLKEHIRGYLISHAHLDHIAALVLNSQIDTPKPILGLDPTIDNLRDHIFNGRIWPNYGSEGSEPILNLYEYVRLALHQPISIASMEVEPYLLSHPRGYPSTAFLVGYRGDYVLYFGDTSSDAREHEKHLARIWRRVGPLVKEGKLKGIFLECSYPHERADKSMYGHLDSKLMLGELAHLQEISQAPVKGLKVIVTHRKELLQKGPDPKEVIEKELLAGNTLGIDFIFPSQGDKIFL